MYKNGVTMGKEVIGGSLLTRQYFTITGILYRWIPREDAFTLWARMLAVFVGKRSGVCGVTR